MVPDSVTVRSVRRADGGFVVIAVLLVISVIAVMGTAYVRHVDADRRDSELSAQALDRRAALESGAEVARKAVHVGKALDMTHVDAGQSSADIESGTVAPSRSRLFVRAVGDDGVGATALAETAWVPMGEAEHPDALPRLDSSALYDLLADTSVTHHVVTGSTTISDTVLEGVVVVSNSSVLYLSDVAVNGCIVSEDALTGGDFGDYDKATLPAVVINGNVRIDAADFLPGVAVCMPDGLLMTSSAESRIQIDGDVVAHSLFLEQPGTLSGSVAAVESTLHASFDRPGAGRRPQEWSPSLDTSRAPMDVDFMAFVPRVVTVDDLTAISQLELPSVGDVDDEEGGE